MVYAPSSLSSAERIEKLEYTTSEVERERMLVQKKMTHLGILSTSLDLDLHVKQYFYVYPNWANREINDQMYVANMPRPNTVMFTVLKYFVPSHIRAAHQ